MKFFLTSTAPVAKAEGEMEKETASFQTGLLVFFLAVVFFFLSLFPLPIMYTFTYGSGPEQDKSQKLF